MMDCLCFAPRSKQSLSTSALLTAAKEGDVDAVVAAVKAKPRVAYYAQSWGGGTVWHLAARHGHVDVLLGLLAALAQLPEAQLRQHLGQLGANHDAVALALMEDAEGKGLTPLHLACVYGHVQVISLLMERKVNPFAQDVLGRTPLHYAASLGRVSCIRAMLEGWGGHQARWVLPPPNKPTTALVDAATPAGCTPLHYAVWGNHKAVIQALLSYDARLDVATIAGEVQWVQVGAGFTPLHVAAVKGDYDIVKLLLAGHVQGLAAGAEVMQATHGQWGARHTGDPRHLRTARGMMAYHLALGAGHSGLAELLHPDIPYTFIFSNDDLQDGSVRTFGPPRLMVIAAGALQRKLLCELEAVKEAAAAAAAAAEAAGLAAAQQPRVEACAAPDLSVAVGEGPPRLLPLTALQLASQQKQSSQQQEQNALKRCNSHPLDAAALQDQQQQAAAVVWCAAAATSNGSCSTRGGKPPLPVLSPAPSPFQRGVVSSMLSDGGSRGASLSPPPPAAAAEAEAAAAPGPQTALEGSSSIGIAADGPTAADSGGEEGVVSPFAAESQRRWSIGSWGNMSWFSGSSSKARASSLQPPGGAGRAASGSSSMQGASGAASPAGGDPLATRTPSSNQQLAAAGAGPSELVCTHSAASTAPVLHAPGGVFQMRSSPVDAVIAGPSQQPPDALSAAVGAGPSVQPAAAAGQVGCSSSSPTAAAAAAASRHERQESSGWLPWQLSPSGPSASGGQQADFDPSTRSVMSDSRLAAARPPLFTARSLQRRAPRWTASSSDLLSTRSLATLSGGTEGEGASGGGEGRGGRRLQRSVSLGLTPGEQSSRRGWFKRDSSASVMSDEEVPRRGAAAPRAVPGKGPAPVEPLERLLSRRAVASGGDPEFKEAVRLLKLASGVLRSPSVAGLASMSPAPGSEAHTRASSPAGLLRSRSRLAQRLPSTTSRHSMQPGTVPDAPANAVTAATGGHATAAAAAGASAMVRTPSCSACGGGASSAEPTSPWLQGASAAAAANAAVAANEPGSALRLQRGNSRDSSTTAGAASGVALHTQSREAAAATLGDVAGTPGTGVLPTIYSSVSSVSQGQPGAAPAGEVSVDDSGAAQGGGSCWGAADSDVEEDEEEEDGEDGCEVCFDAADVVALQHCGHRLCTTCAAAMCKLHHFKPALCPFCRQIISALVLAEPCP